MREMEAIVASVSGKIAEQIRDVETDIGAFDTPELQRAYLSRYLPCNFLDDFLDSRIGYWLCGRYLSTC